MADTRPLPDRMRSVALLLRAVAASIADEELCRPLWELARSYEDLAEQGQGPGRQAYRLQAPQPPQGQRGPSPDLVQAFRRAIVSLVSHKSADLSASEIAAYLGCYADEKAPRIPELAAELQLSIPAVKRALHAIAEFDLVRLGTEPRQGGCAIRRTPMGAALLRDLRKVLAGRTDDPGTPMSGSSDCVGSLL